MARRSHLQLHVLYGVKKSRSTSLADGAGYLYAFVDRGHRWKIGMTNNFARRQREWNRQCPSSSRVWMPPIPVKKRRRAGSSSLLYLNSCAPIGHVITVLDAGKFTSKSSRSMPIGLSYGETSSIHFLLRLRRSELYWDGLSSTTMYSSSSINPVSPPKLFSHHFQMDR
ncbi:hypothetical protein EV361DRAFT_957126 [Lentinula raphanica]|nr:hypothetical protein FB446DRAFT_794717 [Lentinula raphanica]KAJ3963377.1 hypothetical protein EV361DRAFT_957126 [Lentinula raphanica]